MQCGDKQKVKLKGRSLMLMDEQENCIELESDIDMIVTTWTRDSSKQLQEIFKYS